MKTKHYRYCPYRANGVALGILEIFQTLAWVYTGTVLLDFLRGKNQLPMVFLLTMSLCFLGMRYFLFRQYQMSLCFTEAGLSIGEKPGKERFIPWEELPYGYVASTSRVAYLVLTREPLSRKELFRLVRRAAYGWRIVLDGKVCIPRHIISGTTPGISDLGEVLPESVRILKPEDSRR